MMPMEMYMSSWEPVIMVMPWELILQGKFFLAMQDYRYTPLLMHENKWTLFSDKPMVMLII